ncbi:MAG: hypothetical protein RSG77_14985 [Hafnia sp.]
MKKEIYEEELSVINAVYGIGRQSRMKDLVAFQDNWDGRGAKALLPESMALFMRFIERFGKVADDLSLFLSHEGHLLISWSFWVNDPAIQRRGGLTRRVDIEFTKTNILYFRYGMDKGDTTVAPDGDEIKALVERYRSHHLTE